MIKTLHITLLCILKYIKIQLDMYYKKVNLRDEFCFSEVHERMIVHRN